MYCTSFAKVKKGLLHPLALLWLPHCLFQLDLGKDFSTGEILSKREELDLALILYEEYVLSSTVHIASGQKLIDLIKPRFIGSAFNGLEAPISFPIQLQNV